MYRPTIWAILVTLMMLSYTFLTMAQNGEAEEASSDEATAEASDGGESAPADPTDEGAEAKPPADKMDKGTYTVRLRDLEDRVNRLKEQIFRSKARLSLLAETVLDKKIAGAKASVLFRNEMGGSFRLDKATFLLDGGPVFNKTDKSGSLAKRDKLDLFEGPVTPGDHTLSVVLHYKGHGYGIFSYLKGYAFKTRSSYTFTVGEGKSIQVQVVGFEKGGATTPLEERPAVRYIEELSDYEGEADEGEEASE